RAQIARIIVEGAAAQHAFAAAGRRIGAAVARRGAVAFAPAIGDPFGGIAGHVVEAEGVGRELADLARLPPRLRVAADAVRLFRADRIAPGVVGGRAGAGGIFPFGLGRQAIFLSCLQREPDDIGAGIVPVDVGDRALAAAEIAIARAMAAAALGDAGVPFGEGDLAGA